MGLICWVQAICPAALIHEYIQAKLLAGYFGVLALSHPAWLCCADKR
ncbi:hypothetical protein SALWKB12_0057 [Snodgrassella communis]|nr:hypothetical protein SALWKB12_0057 [Snodgrassella communis]